MCDMLDSLRRLKQRFIDEVFEFVSIAIDQPSYVEDEGIRCPCVRYFCQKILKPSHVRVHQLEYGFKPYYHIWIYHEENRPTNDNLTYASTSYDNMNYDGYFGSVTKMVYDAYKRCMKVYDAYK